MCCCDAEDSVASYTAAYALLRAETLFRPYNGANVGGHASLRDTCHMCLLSAVATQGSVASYTPRNHQHPSPNTQHPSPITQHPSPITQHPDGGVSGGASGEVSGEMFGQHLTIQKSRVQRVFAHFGEVSAAFTKKLHRRRVSHKK